MATFSAVFSFSAEAAVTAALGATTATAEIVLGNDRKFLIRATGDFNLKMGGSGMSAASASDFQFSGAAAGSGAPVYTLCTNSAQDRIRIFNPGASGINYWIQPLTN